MYRLPIAGFVAILATAGSAHAEDAPFDHNGSRMAVDYERGAITYRTVKTSLRSFVRPGLVAFSGEIERRGVIKGTAFTFRNGCDAAGYPVSGRYDPSLPGYVLTGAAPVREKGGCRVTGYSLDTPNARLEFIDLTPGDGTLSHASDAAMDTAPRPRQPAPRN